MPDYRFLPWLREGLVARLPVADEPGATVPGRARLDLELEVARRSGAPLPVTRSLEVAAPGDIIGVDHRQVIRTDPKPGTTDFEPNYLPLVEFDRPDFPWLFTPARAGAQERLRPWIVLVVIALGDGVSLVADPGRPLPVLTIEAAARPSRQLPDLAESWAWAHGQVLSDPAERIEDLLADRPDRTASRLVCPRRLDPATRYVACVVPAFRGGSRAGLGLTPETADDAALEPAWGPFDPNAPEAPVQLPVYTSWEFQTGAGGDFESLARALKARPIPPEVGRTDVYFGAAGAPLPALAPDAEGGVVGVRGALVGPDDEPSPWPAATSAAVQQGLREVLDRPARRLGTGAPAGEGPAVSPPLYGSWLAAQRTVPEEGGAAPWLRTLNVDPRHRAIAGIATKVVQSEQERLMEQAWAQVGAIERANRELRWAQLAIQVRGSLVRRHVAPLAPGRLLDMTAATHRRLLADGATLAARARDSTLTEAALTAPFRRVVRPRGPLARRLYPPAQRTQRPLVEGLDGGTLTAAAPERPPDGLFGFAASAPAGPVTAALLAQVSAAAQSGAANPPRTTTPAKVRAVTVSDALASGVAIQLLQLPRIVAGGIGGGVLGGQVLAQPGPGVTTPGPSGGSVIAPPGGPIIGPAGPVTVPPTKERSLQLTRQFKTILVSTFESIDLVAVQPSDPPLPAFEVAAMRGAVLAQLDPARTVRARVGRRIRIPDPLRPIPPRDPLDDVLAAPTLAQPAWELLRDHFPEQLLPGLEHVPADTATAVKTNPQFIEALLIGLNHEFARELLWREFPTDQRGSAFRRFWAPGGRDDIEPIHRWSEQADLGDTVVGGRESQLVLLVRGDLLRRYPSTVIYAAPDAAGRPQVQDAAVTVPLFRGRLDPDVTFAGFDLTVDEARAGWWFVFEEQPTEPRFGLDVADGFGDEAPDLNQWNDLSWNHLVPSAAALAELDHIAAGAAPPAPVDPAGAVWGANSAAMAQILAQQPVRVCLRAADLLRPR